MRTIKYQAWDTEAKRMIEWQELLDYGSGLVEYFVQPRELIFREFTGLVDKNGKEIYEGDILSHYGDNYNGVIEWSNEDEKIEGTGWCIHEYYPKKGLNREPDRFHTTSAYTSEKLVIGNIYETPDLKRCWGKTHTPQIYRFGV